MRIGSLALSFLTAALLAGCASPGVSQAGTNSQPGSEFKVDLNRGDEEAKTFGEYLSARFAATQHNIADAAQYYRSALERDPDNSDLRTFAFFYSTSAGQVDEAARIAEQLVKKPGDDRAARLALAVRDLKHHDYAGARKNLNQSAKGPFTTLTSAIVDAWAALGAGDDDGALADLKSVSTDSGGDALSQFHLALLNDSIGRNPDADTAYRAALLKAGPSPRIVDAYGRFLERNGRTAEANALYDKVASDPALAPIATAAKSRIASGRKPDQLVQTPQDGAAEALFGIAGSLSDASSADVSILYLRLALYLRPNLDLAGILLADRLEALEKYGDAISVYRNISHDSPYWRLAAVQIAIDESRLSHTDEAIAELKQLTAAAPQDVEGWTALGDAYRAAERWPEAAAAYDQAAKAMGPVEAKDWPLYYARAIAEERSHNWDKAEADLRTALKLSPDEPQVLNYLGYSWVDKGQNIPAALAMLEKARQLRPFDGYIVDSVGWAYFKLGRWDDAAKTLQNAILLVPGDPTINDHLGDAYWRVGKKLDARFQWSHALAFGPEPDEKVSIQKKLKDGLSAGDKPT